jgi:two-component system CheB/CheR fusion protein
VTVKPVENPLATPAPRAEEGADTSASVAPERAGDADDEAEDRAAEPELAARFPIVAVGASAGGLEAIEQLITPLKPCNIAFLIVQHLSSRFGSSLPELLAHSTNLPVHAMQDGATITPCAIYTAPPGVEVHVQGDQLRLRPLSEIHRHHPIDALFRSLALAHGPNAIAVVLSGAGTDGSLGIRSIKEEGGITFAQDPASATQPSMPQSALDSGCVDFSLTPAAIGEELMRIGAHPYVARQPSGRFAPELLNKLFDQLHRMHGVDFSSYKPSTVERRIQRRMTLQHTDRPSDYVKLVESSRSELNALYDDLLIGVTGFFRDQEPFDLLKSAVLPLLFERRSLDLPIRVWVPGCATGEEAYSIAICLLEYIEENQPGQRLQVFATDIDENALARARLGTYPPGIELDVSPERLQRFFTRAEKGYQVSRRVRDMVVFARHNLGKDPPFSRLDLISCRNLLIYLQPALQKRVMRVFHYALNARGCLLLGTAESVGEASDLFSLLDRRLKLYVKKHGAAPGVFEFAFGNKNEDSAAGMNAPTGERKPEVSIQQLADRKTLERYAPPGVLIDEGLNILQFRGQTGPLLAPSPGAATLSIVRMIRQELLVPLKAAVQQVLHEGTQVSCDPVRLAEHGDRAVAIDVIPIDAAGHPRCLLVLFRDVTPQRSSSKPSSGVADDQLEQKRVKELERELLSTKDYLETIIQELATSNEELQSSNEELQSSNEELQSTNEELETSKEELQASNEELVTVNEELQTRIAQLGIANDDLVNVLMNVTSPVLLVGLDLRIRRFSTAAERLLDLVPSDIGRPISYLGTVLNVPQIEAAVSEAMNTMRAKEVRVRCSNGAWYVMHTAPYQTQERTIRGLVIELIPVTAPQGHDGLPKLDELVGKVLDALPGEVVLLDQALRMVWMNRAFQSGWSTSGDLLGQPLASVVERTSESEPLWSAIVDTALAGRPFENLTLPERGAPQAGAGAIRWSGRALPAEPGRDALTLLTIERRS